MNKSDVAAEPCVALGASAREFQAYPAREVALGSLVVRRALPVRGRRLVGPWCFLDRFGPLAFAEGPAIDVAPHPHMGLQTVTWLLDGEVVHEDSLSNESLLRSGGVNVMTSGHAIAHAERTPPKNSGRLNGVQLWTALLDRDRHRAGSFQHVREVPRIEHPGGIVSVFSGRCDNVVSSAEHFSDLVGADLRIHPRSELTFPVEPEYEHAILLLQGDAAVEGQGLDSHTLYYLGTCRSELSMTSVGGGLVLLLGGPPFPETILMWWNFVARTPDEIREAREDWEAHRRFGDVVAYSGPRLDAPALLKFAAPNPLS
jgi:redox-sensitive bicupin YhaK (pirin superfamily)